jgi:NCAIR mutase (PurE)-related protein
VQAILRRLLAGELSIDEAEAELRRWQLEELDGWARLDVGREGRRGLPEVVLADAKAPDEAAALVVRLAVERGQGLASRLGPEHWRELEMRAAEAGLVLLRYGAAVRAVKPGFAPPRRPGRVGLITAGTSDAGPALEARMVVEACGLEARLVADVGVAGLHRLFRPLRDLLDWRVNVLVVAAGMDGVLPGVVAGLTDRPVIGLPVGVGYGAGGQGRAALLTMLQSCSTGLVVVNIDNGVGAGAAAVLIAGAAGAAAAGRPRPGRARRESAGPAR